MAVPLPEASSTATPGNDPTTATSAHAGLLVIRAWTEEGSSEVLRAQIRLSTDVTVGFQRTLTVARAEAAVAAVQEWLAAIVSEASRPAPSPESSGGDGG